MIHVSNLTKAFRDRKWGLVRAVDGVSFDCLGGRVFGLLGPNGAGKTTTLRLLSTILTPTGGTATINGYDLVREPELVRTQIGFLSGDTRLYDRLTPRETLFYFGRLNGMRDPEIRARVLGVFDLLDMTAYGDVRCGQLSTGMKQKVSIARTIIHDPPVLVLDEASVGLDIMAARTVSRFIKDCKAQGKCVVLSTHVMGEAGGLCDDIGIIHQGRLLACGTLATLLRQTGTGNLEDAFMAVVGERP